MDSARLNRIFTLALPIVAGMVSQNILNLVDTAMVGVLGNAALAAVGIGGFVTFMCQALILGISTGVQATVARRKGEGLLDRAARTLNSALLLVLIVGPIFSVVLTWLLPRTFHLLNGDPEVVAQALPYLDWRIMAITFVGMNFAFRGYWNALDMSRIYMSTLVVMHISNIFFNWVLIFGHLGAPALGVEGAGIASAIAMVIGTATYMVLGMTHAREHGFMKGIGTRDEIVKLIRLSVPAGIQQFFFAAGFVATFWIIGKVGTAELAAANVLINIMLVALLPGLGLGLACSTLVGQAIGRGHPDDAYQWGWDVAKVAAVVMTTLGLPMLLTPDLVTMHFLHDPATRELARWPMRLVGMWMPIEALGFTMMHALYGAGDSRRVMKISILFQWGLFLPAAYLVGPVLGFGLLGIWLMQGAYRILQSMTFMRYWKFGGWRELVV